MNNLIKVVDSKGQSQSINFIQPDESSSFKAQLEVTSLNNDTNVAYKIKTTAPKLFVVKPIQGIVAPGKKATVNIELTSLNQAEKAKILKNRFLVQATPTNLQVTENFQLVKFWDEKAASKDKSSVQQCIMSIIIHEGGDSASAPKVDMDRQGSRSEVMGSMVTSKDEPQKGQSFSGSAQTAPQIPASTGGGYGGYENAPKDDINQLQSGAAPSQSDLSTLQKLEEENKKLQEEVNTTMNQISNDNQDQGNLYKWQTSEDKPGENGGKFSSIHLVLVFLMFFSFGFYMKLLN